MNIWKLQTGEIVCLVLTNIDLKLFFEQYKVTDLTYECRLEI